MVLKFLAGLVLNDKKALERYWDAILLSKDGQIEIVGKDQVDLLAHLLSQSIDENGKISSDIPQEIKFYVDRLFKSNIVAWSKTIKDSGYKPENIVELV
jgi:hypothetical protein